MVHLLNFGFFVSLLFSTVLADGFRRPMYHHLPPLREQVGLQNTWTKERVENVPNILKKYGVDAWLMSQKEYAEDTVFWSLKSAKQFSARRRTVNLFISSPTNGTPSSYTWIDNTPQLWTEILSVFETQLPKKIAINADEGVSFSSGLHAGELEKFKEELGDWSQKFVVEPMVAVEFIATMPQGRWIWYRKLQETAWAMISEGFSERVIEPGVTTTEDVEWWLRSKIQSMNYTTWFHPSVSILVGDSPFENLTDTISLYEETSSPIINYGDLLHVDFGVTALGMNTDTQHMAYVLYPGETPSSIPTGYLTGLATVNKLQDIVRSNMHPGTSGNTILTNSLAQMHALGIEGRIYCHPIGDWGHAAGTVIGMFNLQDGVPVLGDLPLLKNSYASVELYAESWVEELNKTVMFFLEEDVYWDERTGMFEWVWGRQEWFHVVKTEDGKGGGRRERVDL